MSALLASAAECVSAGHLTEGLQGIFGHIVRVVLAEPAVLLVLFLFVSAWSFCPLQRRGDLNFVFFDLALRRRSTLGKDLEVTGHLRVFGQFQAHKAAQLLRGEGF